MYDMDNLGSSFRETDIRPDHLMKSQQECVMADIEWLVQRITEFVAVPCPACCSSQANELFKKQQLTYRMCLNCSTVYVSPRPTPSILDDFYRQSVNYAYWNTHIFPASEEARRKGIFAPRAQRLVEICDRYGASPENLMEVGAGFGTFCEEVIRTNLSTHVFAVEPTPDLAETCRRKGLHVFETPFEQMQSQDVPAMDVIAAFEVIEHLFSPKEFFLKSRSLLVSQGLLVVTCPSYRGFDLVTLQTLSATIDHEHLNYFNPNSLTHLAQECGFDVLEVLTPGKLDAELVRKKHLSGEYDLSSQPFLKQILVDEWERVGEAFQQFLADNRLSSHMWLVARNKG
jgi:2-polyprenyl-3-methyl-5-hydroxy-6-metoxy-1,4-benzoquinol methylase